MKATLATLSIRRKLITMASALAIAVGTAAGANAQEAAGPREGIKVHGHWIIEVKNPDGTRAQYREFDNHLVAQGGPALAKLLGIQTVPSTWFVWLGSSAGGDICQRAAGIITSCAITTPLGATGGSPNEFFPNLQITAPTSGPNAGKLVFSGSVTSTSPAPSSLGYVLTQLWMCPTTFAAGAGCLTQGLTQQANFTQATVSPAIPIQPGQVIQVTVIISFS
jgi:hypothetical protein